ncbi:hypothetical protein DSO57_1001036 [Entomophthora muscae]|uniref:Uncharacterized protein n=1 Tax=Entomophthora muscae TaxID=34485 RepID=A0ACC2UVS0_9FUNG|nr:hypothetical protein DSO57_1001036 [Entomophthora muscae]
MNYIIFTAVLTAYLEIGGHQPTNAQFGPEPQGPKGILYNKPTHLKSMGLNPWTPLASSCPTPTLATYVIPAAMLLYLAVSLRQCNILDKAFHQEVNFCPIVYTLNGFEPPNLPSYVTKDIAIQLSNLPQKTTIAAYTNKFEEIHHKIQNPAQADNVHTRASFINRMKHSVAALIRPEANTSMFTLIAKAKHAEKRANMEYAAHNGNFSLNGNGRKTPMAINARTPTIITATPIATMAIATKAQTAPVPRKRTPPKLTMLK